MTALAALVWPRTALALTYERAVVAFIGVSILVRLICAANTPLAFDEALYWRYSKHLAAGFLDHPFMNPLMIRLGTSLLGDTPLGVRFFAVLSAIPASWAVWRAGAVLFSDERLGATSALFLNLTLVMTIGSVLATSDPFVVTASSCLLFALAKLNETERGEWWIAAGAAFGLGMCSKYTMAFFAVSIFAWLAILPENRKWLFSWWTWAGGALALAIFAPVLVWNAQHEWASFVYQGNRMAVHGLTLRYLGELIASQIGLATPPVFFLAVISLIWVLPRSNDGRPARLLIKSLTWPIVVYFAWHALHQRVQGNWPEAMYPALVIAAAVAAHEVDQSKRLLGALARWSTHAALPVGVGIAVIAYVQSIFGVVTWGPSDPTARMLGVGWPNLAARIEQIRLREHAATIVGTEYQVVSWLTFYRQQQTPVVQLTQRIRWANEPTPDEAVFQSPALYVCKMPCGKEGLLRQKFAIVEQLDVLPRTRGKLEIDRYAVYRLLHPRAVVLDPLYADLKGENIR